MPTALQGILTQSSPAYAGALTTAAPKYSGAISLYLPEMSAYYLLNRYDITALTGGTPSKLDGFDITLLKQGNARLALYFTGSVLAIYRLRAKGVDAESLPWRVVSDVDAAYLWELEAVCKQGVPCVWNADTSKFHQVMASGAAGVVAVELDQTGFALPTT